MTDASVKSILLQAFDWLHERIKERTSWDGLTIIAISLIALVATPLVRYAAWVGLIYGVWTLWKHEKKTF